MNRRSFMTTTLAGWAALSTPALQFASAQQSTPVAGSTIEAVRWELQSIEGSDSTVTTPDNPAQYAIQFGADSMAYIQADCNRAGAPFTIDGQMLTFGEMLSTLALCGEESISDQFMQSLGSVVSFVITTDASDQLVLNMMADAGSLYFNPVVTGVVWQWVEFQSSDGSVITANDPSRYTIEFMTDGSLQVLADCNRGFGDAKIEGNSIDLIVATTRMMCAEDSQFDEFLMVLDQAVSWVIRDGMLALALPADAGIALFQPVLDFGNETEPEATPAP